MLGPAHIHSDMHIQGYGYFLEQHNTKTTGWQNTRLSIKVDCTSFSHTYSNARMPMYISNFLFPTIHTE